MQGRTRISGLVAVGLCLLAVCAAHAADSVDPGFGEGGFVQTPVSAAFDHGPVAPNVWDLADEGEGRFVGALADLTDSQDYFGLVRYRADGSLADDFGDGGLTRPLELRGPSRTQAQAVAVQPGGRIVAAGFRLGQGRGPFPLLVGYRPDGSLDPSFGTGGIVGPKRPGPFGTEALHDLAVGPDGRLFAVGGADEHGIGESGRRPAGVVSAYRPDGRIDRSFGDRGHVYFPAKGDKREYTGLKAVEVLPDGRILVAGFRFGSLFVARLLPDGRLDLSFGAGDGQFAVHLGSRSVGCFRTCWSASPFAIRPDGRIVVVVAAFPEVPVLVGLLPDGRIDRGFGRRGFVRVRIKGHSFEPFDLALQGSRIVLAGWDERQTDSAQLRFSAIRYLRGGTVDRSFGRGGAAVRAVGEFSGAFAALEQAGGGVVVGGGGEIKEGDRYRSRLALTRYLAG